MKDLGNNLTAIKSISPASLTATTTGTHRDMTGFDTGAAIVSTGAISAADASNLMTLTILTGDLADGSDLAAIDSGDYINAHDQTGATWDRLINNTDEADQCFLVGFVTRGKKYAAAKLTETSTFSGIVGVSLVKGRPANAPV